jgi:hypothetical protein
VQKLTEAQIEQAVCQWLHFKKYFVFKLKDQTAYRDGKRHKTLPFQINGVADLCAIKNGETFWIEIKTPTGTQSQAQKVFQKNIEMQGGNYWLIRSLDELKERLNNI